MEKIILIVVIVLIVLAGLIWTGLKIQPAAFPAFPQASVEPEKIPLPAGLPAPVERFYRAVYGDQIPVIHSVVITGRAQIRPAGPINFPARFRFTHDVGQGYRHYIEATLFGLPIMKVNERYLDGIGYGETPFGISEGEQVDQAANLGMWAELAWVPAAFLTDTRVQWLPGDEQTATLVVPFKDGQQQFVVRFDPQTGLLQYMEAARYKDATTPVKTLWITESKEYRELDGTFIATRGTATWMDDGKPWATFNLEDLRVNVDIKDYIRAKGQ